MEELARLQDSHKAFKGHVTQLHSKIDDLMDRDFDDYTVTSLPTDIEQIKKEGNKIAEMDERISTLIDDATELMYDAEQFQDDIIDQIARATRYMELCTANSNRRSLTPPHVNSQLDSQQPLLEGVNSSVVESVTENTYFECSGI